MASQANLKVFGLDVPHMIKLKENASSDDDRIQLVVSNDVEGVPQVYLRLHEMLKILYYYNSTTKTSSQISHLAKAASEALKFEFHSFALGRSFPFTTLEQTKASISFLVNRPKGKQPSTDILKNFFRVFNTLQGDSEEAIRSLIYDPAGSSKQQDPVAHDDCSMEDESMDYDDVDVPMQSALQVCRGSAVRRGLAVGWRWDYIILS